MMQIQLSRTVSVAKLRVRNTLDFSGTRVSRSDAVAEANRTLELERQMSRPPELLAADQRAAEAMKWSAESDGAATSYAPIVANPTLEAASSSAGYQAIPNEATSPPLGVSASVGYEAIPVEASRNDTLDAYALGLQLARPQMTDDDLGDAFQQAPYDDNDPIEPPPDPPLDSPPDPPLMFY